jgi:hypothetical protein
LTSKPDSQRGAGWTEARIRGALREFLRGRGQWPTYRDFQRAGLRGLRDTITRTGGVHHWARELGIPYGEHRPGYAPVWTEERIRRELGAYLAGKPRWPVREQFEKDGRKALRDAVNRTGGPDRWAAEFGLERTSRLSGIRRGWTPSLIESKLKELIGDRTEWPTRAEFDAAGLASMLTSIYLQEGPDYWARRMGVTRGRRPAAGRAGAWTEQRIREELDFFCSGRDAWPTEREFVDAGKRALYAAASRNGGVARWAKELGLPRGRRRS